MIARKCDRCNNFYDEYYGKNSWDANAVRTLCKKRAGSEYNTFDCNTYDLCPKCMDSLINWLDMNMTEVKK